MASTIQVRVEDDLKMKSDQLFKALGTDTTTAIRIFLTQAVENDGFPFEIKRNLLRRNPYTPMTEKEIEDKLECSRNHCEEGRCREAGAVIADMRAKYGI